MIELTFRAVDQDHRDYWHIILGLDLLVVIVEIVEYSVIVLWE